MTNLPHTMETYGIGSTTTVTGTITTTTAAASDPEQGWQCPVCKRIYAPWKDECSHCPANDYSWVPYQYYQPYYLPTYTVWGSEHYV